MAIKIYWLHEFSTSARLGIMARPRGNDWLEEEILSLRKQNVQVIVSLLEKEEITELGLRNKPIYAQSKPFNILTSRYLIGERQNKTTS
jgi:hypothetical protein